MSRPSKDAWLLSLALETSRRATCARRKVGCVLVDSKHRVLSTGYNGPPSCLPHCTDQPCAGAKQAPGTGLELCEAVHAEQNALLQCRDVDAIHTCYTTATPCVHCVKLLLATGCQQVVALEEYPHDAAFKLWVRGRPDGCKVDRERDYSHVDGYVERITCPTWKIMKI